MQFIKIMSLQSSGCFFCFCFLMHTGEVDWREKSCQAYSMLWQKEVNVGVVQEITLSPVWKVLKRGAWQESEHAEIEGTTHRDTADFSLGVVLLAFSFLTWITPFPGGVGSQAFPRMGLYHFATRYTFPMWLQKTSPWEYELWLKIQMLPSRKLNDLFMFLFWKVLWPFFFFSNGPS